MKVTDAQLDYLASVLARRFNEMFDAEDRRRERMTRRGAPDVRPREKYQALCRRSSLDFLAYQTETRTMLITPDMSKRWPERFEKHLLLCQACGLREECLEIALRMGEEVGIWGGTLPHERLEMSE